MVSVRNNTKIDQHIGSHEVKAGESADWPYETAVVAAGMKEFTVADPVLTKDFPFKRDGQTYLGWSSPLHYADGYGSIAQEIARTFLDNGIQLSIYPRDYDPSHERFGGFSLDEWEEKAFVPKVVVDRLRSPQTPCFYGINMTWPREVHEHMFCRGIALTMFETTRLPKGWSECLNMCPHVIVPCRQNKQAFEESGTTAPIHIVPLGVNPSLWPMRTSSGRSERPYTFLMSAGLTYRKNPDGAAKAFLAAFGQSQEVRLILKTRGSQCAEGFREWAKDVPCDDRIEIVCEESTPEQMVRYMHEADAFVFPSRGEGFGLTPLQAMCTGLPVIVSDNSGMSEYCDVRYNVPIPCREVPVPKPPSPASYPKAWGDVGNWWEPDFDRLVGSFRWCFFNQDSASLLGAKAALWVRRQWTVQKTCEGIMDVIEQDAREGGLSW